MNAKLNDEQEQYLKSLDELTSPGTSLIADDFADEIYDLLAQNGAWATLGVKQIFSKKAKFAITTAYPNASFILQGVTLNDDSAFAGTSVLADTATVACLVKCSVQSLEDTEVDLSAHLLENFSEAINNRLDTGVFIGNGTVDANNGGMTGIFSDGTIATVNAGAGHTNLGLCNRDDFLAVVGSVSANALQRPCRWWVSSALLPALMRCKDDAGRPMVVRPAGEADFYLLDFPITLVPVAPNVNTAGQKVMAFGDPRAYAVALRNWFVFEASSHAGWNALQRNFRAYGDAKGQLRLANGLATLTTAAV